MDLYIAPKVQFRSKSKRAASGPGSFCSRNDNKNELEVPQRRNKDEQEAESMNQMTLDEVKRIAASGDYRRIPVTREILADIRTCRR